MKLTIHPNEWMQYTSQLLFIIQSHKDQDGARTSILPNKSQEFSSPKSMTSRGRDVTRGIQPKFVYQSTSPNYYEPVEHWEVDENTNVDVFEETEENQPQSFEYAKVQVNAFDEVS